MSTVSLWQIIVVRHFSLTFWIGVRTWAMSQAKPDKIFQSYLSSHPDKEKAEAVLASSAHPSPLMFAIRSYQTEHALVLLEAGADKDQVHDSITPLICAAELKDMPVLQALLDAGADPQWREPLANTDYLVYAFCGVIDIEICQYAMARMPCFISSFLTPYSSGTLDKSLLGYFSREAVGKEAVFEVLKKLEQEGLLNSQSAELSKEHLAQVAGAMRMLSSRFPGMQERLSNYLLERNTPAASAALPAAPRVRL